MTPKIGLYTPTPQTLRPPTPSKFFMHCILLGKIILTERIRAPKPPSRTPSWRDSLWKFLYAFSFCAFFRSLKFSSFNLVKQVCKPWYPNHPGASDESKKRTEIEINSLTLSESVKTCFLSRWFGAVQSLVLRQWFCPFSSRQKGAFSGRCYWPVLRHQFWQWPQVWHHFRHFIGTTFGTSLAPLSALQLAPLSAPEWHHFWHHFWQFMSHFRGFSAFHVLM